MRVDDWWSSGLELDRLAGRRRERECRGPLSQRTLCFSYFSVLPEKPIWVKEQFLTRLSLQLCGADRAALQATGFSRCDQSARRTHPLCSKPAGLGVQLKPPAEEQDGEEHDQHSEGNTGCVHKSDPSWQVLQRSPSIDPARLRCDVLTWRSGSTSCKIAANGVADRSLAEKPKMGELQMDWLRSEDLKEEKNVTAPN